MYITFINKLKRLVYSKSTTIAGFDAHATTNGVG